MIVHKSAEEKEKILDDNLWLYHAAMKRGDMFLRREKYEKAQQSFILGRDAFVQLGVDDPVQLLEIEYDIIRCSWYLKDYETAFSANNTLLEKIYDLGDEMGIVSDFSGSSLLKHINKEKNDDIFETEEYSDYELDQFTSIYYTARFSQIFLLLEAGALYDDLSTIKRMLEVDHIGLIRNGVIDDNDSGTPHKHLVKLYNLAKGRYYRYCEDEKKSEHFFNKIPKNDECLIREWADRLLNGDLITMNPYYVSQKKGKIIAMSAVK